ncbi:MAG: ATP-binding cassette domain-containing protein [Deltaproteobacteria bacterium]|nr:ATP-binding cassette domain-containing protein [Deltaproteobacteria bacterium]
MNVVMRLEPGTDKQGRPESCGVLELRPGEVTTVAGPTGSGKTRLLADIERLTPGDSPTGRKVVLSGVPDEVLQSGFAVGRISQAMQFFLDLTVREFVKMHAQARGNGDKDPTNEDLAEMVANQANRLAGEPFQVDQPLATLSGGQARALMVADVVLVADAPVLLIDEIENAGIDRHAALEFLIEERRIVLIATHDPLIMLKSDRRLVMAEGGIRHVIDTSDGERAEVERLTRIDREMAVLRDQLRRGGTL